MTAKKPPAYVHPGDTRPKPLPDDPLKACQEAVARAESVDAGISRDDVARVARIGCVAFARVAEITHDLTAARERVISLARMVVALTKDAEAERERCYPHRDDIPF